MRVKSEILHHYQKQTLNDDNYEATIVERFLIVVEKITQTETQGYQVLAPNWVRFVPNWTNLGLLEIRFQYNLTRTKMYY